MFELGTTKHWWDSAKKYPMLSKHDYTLKPLGYAEAIKLIEQNNFSKILEVGHGANSFAFQILKDGRELWGLDDVIKDSAVSEEDLLKFRNWYPNVKFVSGLLGKETIELPTDYFDFIFSVSVIEHIPHDQLSAAFSHAYKLLKPGGMMFHSYDVHYGQNVRAVFDAFEGAGFEWLKPKETMNVFWEDWLCKMGAEEIKEIMTRLMTENPMFVAEVYMWQKERDVRPAPLNWVSILTAGVKPLAKGIDAIPAESKSDIAKSEVPALNTQMNEPTISGIDKSLNSVNELSIVEKYDNEFLSESLMNERFDYFTYSKKRHFEFFKDLKYDIELFGTEVDPDNCDLKVYQDLLTFAFIKLNYKRRIKMLDVGGGSSRILNHFKNDHECWNIDKLEGMGNGPLSINADGTRLIYDYMGNFNVDLPNDYFDLVFSISTLEHTPLDDIETYENVLKDINRVLKNGCYSLHSIDVVWLGDEYIWTNEILNYFFNNQKMLNKFVPFEEIIRDPNVYVMSEEYFNNNWRFTTGKEYKDFGKPLSYNFLWKK